MLRNFITAILIVAMVAGTVFAAGTVTCSNSYTEDRMAVMTVSWTAGDAGALDSTDLFAAGCTKVTGYIVRVTTNPGSPAPTDNYDIVLNDDDGVDLMGGQLANRDTSNTETAVPKVDSSTTLYGPAYLKSDTLTMVTSNNAVTSSTGSVKIFVQR